MVSKLGKMVTYDEDLPLKNLSDFSITWLCEVTWHIRYFLSPLATCIYGHQTWPPNMATIHGKEVTLLEGLPPINLYNLSSMCSFEVTWQVKNTISPLSQCIGSQDLPGWWHTVRSSHLYICMTPQWGGHVRLLDKSNTLYLQEIWSPCGKPMDTELVKVLSFCERLPSL